MSPRGRRAPQLGPADLLLAIAIAASCGLQPQVPPIGLVVVRAAELAPALEEAGLDGRTLAATAREGIGAAGLTVDEGTRRSYRATIDVVAFSVVPVEGGRPSMAEVIVELELAPGWAAGAGVRRSGRGKALIASGDRAGAWRTAFKGATLDAARAVALDLLAQRKSTEVLVGELSNADPDVRERSLRTLASRGARAAAKAAAAHVHDPDPEVARAAVDALVAFRDPGTAASLIEAAQAGGSATTIRLIPALVEIGGPDVEGYLLTLRSGHGDVAVREAAASALAKPRGPPAGRGPQAKAAPN